MRKIIAIAGEPGTGKSTLVKKFMEDFSWEHQEPVKLLKSMYCEELNLHVLGVYPDGEIFGGTDRLSMGCQLNVQEFIKNSNCNILFEGDRLTNGKMYNFLMSLPETDFNIIVIKTDKAILQKRYTERGSNQSEIFLKGRETKIRNIETNMDYWPYTTSFKNGDLISQRQILLEICNILEIV